MNEKRRTTASKFLSMVLRHKPDAVGITLDEGGWVDVATLLRALSAHGTTLSRDDLAEIVSTNEKQRFAFSDEGLRIRANQGHSVAVDLALDPVTPPELLYHGTATRFLDAIREEGLLKMQRQHVHLHDDFATAADVGRRHGKLAMLHIRAGEMHRAGHLFYRSANNVWLADAVPPQFIDCPASDPSSKR